MEKLLYQIVNKNIALLPQEQPYRTVIEQSRCERIFFFCNNTKHSDSFVYEQKLQNHDRFQQYFPIMKTFSSRIKTGYDKN